MPGPVITPASPPASPAVPEAPAVAPDPVSPPPVATAPNMSENVAGSVTMPTISFKPPKVQGEDPTDRGSDAICEVLHTRVGNHMQGSRLSLADLVDEANVARLLKLGAIALLEKAEAEALAFLGSEMKAKGSAKNSGK